jgi:hypothetical protein
MEVKSHKNFFVVIVLATVATQHNTGIRVRMKTSH